MEYQEKKGYLKVPANLHNEPYVDGLNSLFESLHEHDERSAVLTLAAFAEDTLGLLLVSYLRGEKQSLDLVHGHNAPLGTFSSRIKISYAIGLLADDHFETLEILRKIRNKFAHNWEGVSFDRQDIAANIISLAPLRFSGGNNATTDNNLLATRLVQKVRETLIDIRLLAKSVDLGKIKAPVVMKVSSPVDVQLVAVDQFD